ncbi:DNA topoisomerase IB [Candidatus Protochlamydia amoebophila]|nr:DNA topoisomerase IB [Candidatus Protochlamydia amoebophila]
MKKIKIKPEACTEIDPKKLAEVANLTYVNNFKHGITRERKGKQFIYKDSNGKVIIDSNEIKRIQALAIPPAYTDVWICPSFNGHIQATGRDAKGRKQYRYHALWKEVSDETKYGKMIAFAQALPTIRKRIKRDLSLTEMSKEKILAVVVYLLEMTLIRVGNEAYAKENNSFGLTTLQNRHVSIEGTKMTFKFFGKSGKQHTITLYDKRLAKIVRRCKDLPGQELFEYMDENAMPVSISSTDVNEYLRMITNDHFTAKDFRTWAGTVLTVFALQEFEHFDSHAQAKRNIVQAIEKVAKKLGNTPAICRKSYVHPEVFNAYLDQTLFKMTKHPSKKSVDLVMELSFEETYVLNFLKKRMK